MATDKIRYEEDEDDGIYIPDLGDPDDLPGNWKIDGNSPRSNAGIELNWSNLEQQMFDLLLVNRFNTDSHDTLEDQIDTVNMLLDNFDENEILRICSVAMLAKQLSATEHKIFSEECKKYTDYISKHPQDAEN